MAVSVLREFKCVCVCVCGCVRARVSGGRVCVGGRGRGVRGVELCVGNIYIFLLVNFCFSYGTCTLLFLCIRLLVVIHVLLS